MLRQSRRLHLLKGGVLAAWLCAAFILVTGNLHGQTITAKIVGTITDASKGAVPNASVAAANVRTSEVFGTNTNASGNYEIIVPVGSYTLSVEAKGFEKALVTPFTLTVDQVARVDVELKVGAVTQQVQVEAKATSLQTEQASVSTVIDSHEVLELPLNGRAFVQLAWLSPGVNEGTPGSITERRSRGPVGAQVSMEANGTRDTQNRFYYDGIESLDLDSYNFSFSPSIDAIQEFRVESSTYSAEMGGAPGGQVDLITKNGTNKLHGTLWEFNRNSALQGLAAFQPYSPTNKPPYLNQNQFGANIGGPVLFPKVYNGKQRTFFFFNWESGRLVSGSFGGTAYLPPVAYRSGDFSSSGVTIYDPTTGQPFPGNVIPANRIASFASKYLTFVPATNVSLPGVNYLGPRSTTPTPQDQYVGRIDHRVSDKNFFYASYIFNHQHTVATLPTFVWDSDANLARAQNLSLGDTHSFSASVVNEARIGWNRFYEHEYFGTTDNPALNVANIVGIAGVSTRPQDYGPPAFTAGAYTMPTVRTNGPRNRLNQVWQGTDRVSVQKGKHAMRIGVDILRRNWTFDETDVPRGTFTFDGRTTTLNGATPADANAFAAFLLGLADSAGISAIPFETRLNSWWDDAYFQDDWKLTPNLTLNIGLRYDYFSPPVQRGADQNFALNGVIPGYVPSQQLYHDVPGYTNTPGYPPSLVFPDRRDWGPRFGFAWRVPGISDFVVRGGYGIYYTPEISNTYTDMTLGAPIVPTYSITTNYYSPFNAATVFATTAGVPMGYYLSDYVMDPNARMTYNQQWNLTLQKRLPRDVFVNIGYVGSKGTRLVECFDGNRPITPIPNVVGAPSVNSRRPLQGYSTLTTCKDIGNSTYHSLQMKVERHIAHGFSLLSAYTYSKALASSDSSTVGGGSYLGGIQDIYHHYLDKAPAGFDQRQHLSAAAIYDLPFFAKSDVRPVRAVLAGWQLGTIVSEFTGVASDLGGVGDTTDTGISSRPNVVPGQAAMLPRSQRTKHEWFNTAAFTANVPLGTFGNSSRNPIYLPGLNNVDASAVKNWRFRESGNVQFRAEFFNLFNHVNWGAPGLSVTSPATFGIITSSSEGAGMPGYKRILQFGLKLQF